MNKFNPKVSIVIPVYNGANFLAQAIDSALNQTYKNIEVIVIDDGSNDNGHTRHVMASYGNQIIAIYKANGGCASALNAGIANMSGEYFSWISHDDIYFSHKIEYQINQLKQSGNFKTILYGGYILINESNKKIATVDLNRLYDKNKLKLRIYALLKGAVHGCSLLIHKSHFEEHGLFDVSKLHTQDYDLWFKIFRNKKILCSTEILIKSRVHDHQSSKLLRPDALAEGNQLWTYFMGKLTSEEKISLEGSEVNFDYQMYKMLSSANYLEAAEFGMDSLCHSLKKAKINKHIFLLKKKLIYNTTKFIQNLVVGKLTLSLIITSIIPRFKLIILKRFNKN